MTNRRFFHVFPIVFFLLSCASGDKEPGISTFGPAHTRPSLISETAILSPGETAILGVTFDIEPEWYLYWKGRNDTGHPIKVTPTLPEGYVAGELQWPAPRRHVSPGDILDHIYTDRVTLLLPIQVPADAPLTESATIRCKVEWLACRKVCVPGSMELAITLPIVSGDDHSQNQMVRSAAARSVSRATHEFFAAARARIPKPLPARGAELDWKWEEDALILTAGSGTRILFYPDADSAPLVSALADGASDSGTLTLHLAQDSEGYTQVAGVLEIIGENSGDERIYRVQFPLETSEEGSNNS